MSKRKPNWTDREKMILMEEYEKRKDVLRAKFSSTIIVTKNVVKGNFYSNCGEPSNYPVYLLYIFILIQPNTMVQRKITT